MIDDPTLIQARQIRTLSLQSLAEGLAKCPEGSEAAWKTGVAQAESGIKQSLEEFHRSIARCDQSVKRGRWAMFGGLLAAAPGFCGTMSLLEKPIIFSRVIDGLLQGLAMTAVAGGIAGLCLANRRETMTMRRIWAQSSALATTISNTLEPLGSGEAPAGVAQAERALGENIAVRLQATEKKGKSINGDHLLGEVLGPRTVDNYKAWDHWCAEVLADLEAHGSVRAWTQAGLSRFTMHERRCLVDVSSALKRFESGFALYVDLWR